MYRLHVQLTPQIHEGSMKYYWHIDLHDGNNQITVASGWNATLNNAIYFANRKAQTLGVK